MFSFYNHRYIWNDYWKQWKEHVLFTLIFNGTKLTWPKIAQLESTVIWLIWGQWNNFFCLKRWEKFCFSNALKTWLFLPTWNIYGLRVGMWIVFENLCFPKLGGGSDPRGCPWNLTFRAALEYIWFRGGDVNSFWDNLWFSKLGGWGCPWNLTFRAHLEYIWFRGGDLNWYWNISNNTHNVSFGYCVS